MTQTVKKLLKQYHEFLKLLSTRRFILFVTGITFVTLIPFSPLYMLLDKIEGPFGGPKSLTSESFFMNFLVVSVAVPLIETLVFQWIPIKFIHRFLKWSSLKIILASAILFSLSHCYSLAYIMHSFIIGIILADAFILQEEIRGSPFLVVSIIHGLRNTISLVILSYMCQ